MSGDSDGEAISKAEQQIRHSHQCQKCKTKFLMHGDGCPKCGFNVKVLPLGSIGNNGDYFAHRGLD